MLFAGLLYVNTIPNQYAMDDELVTTVDKNYPHRLTSKGLSAIPQIFREPYYKDDQGYAYDYRPVTLSVFALEHSLFGANPHISHFINVILYALLCGLLLYVLEKLFPETNPVIPFSVTLLYAAHPIHTEVVASIKNRDEIMALGFMLFSFWSVSKTTMLTGAKKILAYTGGFVLLLSILSKPTSIVLLPILNIMLILYDRKNWLYTIILSAVVMFVYMVTQTLSFSVKDYFIYTAIVVFLNVIVYLWMQVRWENVKEMLQKLFEGTKNTLRQEEAREPAPVTKANLLRAISLIAISVAFMYALLLLGYKIALFPVILAMVYLSSLGYHPIWVMIQNLLYWFVLYMGVYLQAIPHYFTLLGLLYYLCVLGNKLRPIGLVYFLVGEFYLLYNDILQGYFLLLPLLLWLSERYFNNVIVRSILIIILLWGPVQSLLNIIQGNTLNKQSEIIDLLFWVFATAAIFTTIYRFKHKYTVALTFLIFLSNSYLIHIPKSVEDFKAKKTISEAILQPLPQAIEPGQMDRPILKVEAVTDHLSPLEYKLGTAAQVLKKYARLLLIPYPMSFYYGYKMIERQSVFENFNAVVILIYVALSVLSFLLLRYNRHIALGLLIITVGLSVYTNIILVAPGMMADRFLFVPSLGFCILVVYLIAKLFGLILIDTSHNNFTSVPTSYRFTLLTVLLIYTYITVARNRDWKDYLTLFAADIGHLENSAQANNLYAVNLMKNLHKATDPQKAREMCLLAEKHFQQALSIYPEFFNAQFDLARTQNILGKYKEAEENFVKAAKMNEEFPTAWYSAAEVAMRQQRFANAVQYFETIPDRHKTGNPSYYLSGSFAYFKNGQTEKAISLLHKGAAVLPQNPDIYIALGQLYTETQKPDSAFYYCQKALTVNPDNPVAKDMLSRLRQSFPAKK